MSILKKITTILFILCITGVSNAYPEAWGQINFSYISINDGLSQSTVFSIAQDKLGNMWFATYDGVNKYDGYTFTVYQHDENDPNSIANDISRIVMTDSKGRVWIGTRDGLSYYDEEKDKFQNFFLEKNGKHLQVNGIVELSPERLLISTLEGLTMFDIPASRFVDDIFGTTMHKMVASALYRHDDQIYIGTPSDGLYCYSIPKNTLEKLAYIPSSKQIQSILQQSPTRIWVATEGSGLLLVNPKTREVKTYRHSPSNPQSISSNYIRSLALDSQNRLWIGTFNDLNIYHEGNDSFMSYSSNPVESGSLSQRSVRSIFMDSQGGMWLVIVFRRTELLPPHPQPLQEHRAHSVQELAERQCCKLYRRGQTEEPLDRNQRWRLEPLHPRHQKVHPLRIAGKPARRRLRLQQHQIRIRGRTERTGIHRRTCRRPEHPASQQRTHGKLQPAQQPVNQ